MREGPRGPARGPAPARSKMLREDIPQGLGGGAARTRQGVPGGKGRPKAGVPGIGSRGPDGPRAGALRAGVWGGRGWTRGVGKVSLSWGLGSCGSESQFRDGGMEGWRRGRRQGAPGVCGGQGTVLYSVCCARVCLYVKCFHTQHEAAQEK